MSKKALVITLSVVGVILIAGGVVAALVLTKGPQTNAPVVVQKDPEACQLLTHAEIVSALGKGVGTVGDAQDQGKSTDADGVTQICFYRLGSKPNAAYSNLTVGLTTFGSDDQKLAAQTRFAVLKGIEATDNFSYFSALNVDDSGAPDKQKSSVAPAEHVYRLNAFKDSKMYSFGLIQPADGDKFTAVSAEKALEALAASL